MSSNHKITFKGHTVALLTRTSTMDCWSFSLPAGKEGSCPMAVYGNNSICGSCYAQINRFNMDNVLKAQWIRFLWTKESIKDIRSNQYKKFVSTLVTAIDESTDNGYFRAFDSGDFFHPNLIWAWIDICKQLPHIKFWFPTRSWQARNDTWRKPFRVLNSLKNVVVRPSALFINEFPPYIKDFSAGSTVITEEHFAKKLKTNLCPKSSIGGSCESNSCRSCWDTPEKGVSYLVHGYRGKTLIPIISNKIKNLRLKAKETYTKLTINSS